MISFKVMEDWKLETTTDLNNLNRELVNKARIFKVEKGNIVDSGEVII